MTKVFSFMAAQLWSNMPEEWRFIEHICRHKLLLFLLSFVVLYWHLFILTFSILERWLEIISLQGHKYVTNTPFFLSQQKNEISHKSWEGFLFTLSMNVFVSMPHIHTHTDLLRHLHLCGWQTDTGLVAFNCHYWVSHQCSAQPCEK